MKRIEIKLALPVVAPLLDVIKELADSLKKNLAAPLALDDLDADFKDAWVGELLSAQNDDVHTLLALFDDEFFSEGIVAFDEQNAETIVRAPLVAEISTPRVMAPGDQAQLTLDLQNFSGSEREFNVKVSADKPLAVAQGTRKVKLADHAKTTLNFPLTAQDGYGVGKIGVVAQSGEIQIDRHFELAVRPQSNIVCFRYVGRGARTARELDALQRRLRAELVRAGDFYLVQTELRGSVYLRTTIINPHTSDADLLALLAALRAKAE